MGLVLDAWGFIVGALLGLVVAWGPLFRLTQGEWVWQVHLRRTCTCQWGLVRDEQCPGARMGRGPKGATDVG